MNADPQPPTTPPKKNDMTPSLPPDTPFKTRLTHEPAFRTADIESRRVAVVEDLGGIPVVSFDYVLF